ncbi:MAG TPA: nucleotide sugar dehydrogenase [Dehalococcoidia bacterium]|nr:nucleotide sugar dehydrogenase [Dehalococcoidia bacterium]
MSADLRVAVVGLGKVGLPLAAQFASKGASVLGCDVDEGVVGAVNDGECPISGEPGLEEALAAARSAGMLRATTDTAAAVRESDVVVCIVPVGIDPERRPDFKHLDAAAAAISGGMRPGHLVVLETTVPVGVTRQRFGRDLARGSGLAPADFDLAYSPERVYSGQVFRDLRTYPKVVGGVSPKAGDRAAAFYRRMLDAEVMLLPDAETAEFAKLAESIYRDVNIALANELARAADALGIDYAAAARAANSQPFSHLHTPGVGVGGHCIPVYPYFLLDALPDLRLVSAGRDLNDGMAGYAVEVLEDALRQTGVTSLEGRTVLVLGLAYRGNVKESAFSSTLLMAAALRARGVRVLVHDPLFSPDEIRGQGLEPSPLPPEAAVDAAVLQAAHREYESLDLSALRGCRVFLDGRGAFERARVEAAGIRYAGIGAGASR